MLILVGLTPVGLILFVLAKFTGTWWAWLLFMGFSVGMLAWAYRRAADGERPAADSIGSNLTVP